MGKVDHRYKVATELLISHLLGDLREIIKGEQGTIYKYHIILNHLASLIKYEYLTIDFILKVVKDWNEQFSNFDDYQLDVKQLKQEILERVN